MFTVHKYAGISKPSLFCDQATLPTSDPEETSGVNAVGDKQQRREYDYVIAGGTSQSASSRVRSEGGGRRRIPHITVEGRRNQNNDADSLDMYLI